MTASMEQRIYDLAVKLFGTGDEVNAWYMTPDQRLDGMCPREAIEAGGVQMGRLLANLEDLASGVQAGGGN
jgi:uncharacterized protein (DUF2384 family)